MANESCMFSKSDNHGTLNLLYDLIISTPLTT
jgi:hypothetical protein